MAMPFYLGATLRKMVVDKIVPDDERSLRQMLSPLLDAVTALHAENCYHRDISPDNILLTPTGPVLLDFGAARRAIGDASGNFTAVLKEGYAPLEQYAIEGAAAMRQGPWTDIYAIAGVMRYVITGIRPPSAVVRSATREDPQEPLVRVAAGRYSKSFLRAIDAGMARYVEERPQSIAQFRAVLAGKAARFNPPVVPKRGAAPPHSRVEKLRSRLQVGFSLTVLSAFFVLIGVIVCAYLIAPSHSRVEELMFRLFYLTAVAFFFVLFGAIVCASIINRGAGDDTLGPPPAPQTHSQPPQAPVAAQPINANGGVEPGGAPGADSETPAPNHANLPGPR
jgi:serine/threonine protein kinase